MLPTAETGHQTGGAKLARIVYEAEVICNGQEMDVKVAPDGTLLGKDVEDEDENENEEEGEND